MLEVENMASHNMSSRQLYRGWVYILLAGFALLFLAWVLDQRNRIRDADAVPAVDSGPATTQETGAAAEEKSADEPVAAEGPQSVETPEEEAAPGSDPGTDPIPAQNLSPTVHPAGEGGRQTAADAAPDYPQRRCALLPNTLSLTEQHLDKTLLVQPVAGGTPMTAVAAGTVVRRFHSPFTGNSVYLLSRGLCYLYGGFAAYEPGLEEGAEVACGQLLGKAPIGDGQAAKLYFSVLKLKPGQDWWRGTAIDPRPFTRPETWADPR